MRRKDTRRPGQNTQIVRPLSEKSSWFCGRMNEFHIKHCTRICCFFYTNQLCHILYNTRSQSIHFELNENIYLPSWLFELAYWMNKTKLMLSQTSLSIFICIIPIIKVPKKSTVGERERDASVQRVEKNAQYSIVITTTHRPRWAGACIYHLHIYSNIDTIFFSMTLPWQMKKMTVLWRCLTYKLTPKDLGSNKTKKKNSS